MSILPTSVPSKRLAESINAASLSIKLNNITGWDGNALTSADFATRLFAVLRNDTNTAMEIIELDPATIASSSITVLKRGMKFTGDLTTEVTANKLTWVKNVTIVELGSDVPQMLNNMVQTSGDQTVDGVKTFSSVPTTTGGNAVGANELVRKAQLDAATLGQIGTDKVIVAGTAGETVAAGNILYLKASDGRWWKALATTAATCEGVQLGIAQGAGTAGVAISGGVLVKGVDTNRTGLTLGALYYLSDTAGAVSATAGTLSVNLGNAKSTTELYFDPRYLQVLNGGEKAAAAGSSGTPSTSNKFVTEADVSAAAGSSKIIRATSGGKLPLAADRIIDTTQTGGETINGGTLPVPCYMDNSDDRWYACDGNVTTKTNFRGFAISNTTAGTGVVMQFEGIVSGFSGLTKGGRYFVQDAVGTIGTTEGTYMIPVGIAISTTEILIQRTPGVASGSMTSVAVTAPGNNDQTITIGFRPRLITLNLWIRGHDSSAATNSYFEVRSIAHFLGTTLTGGMTLSPTASATVGATLSVGTAGAGDSDISMSVSIASISDTGFVIRNQTATGGGVESSTGESRINYIAYE